ncbi:MAG: hypothetical protein ACO307_08520, partial [Ilumatobacteraceae bacterium]
MELVDHDVVECLRVDRVEVLVKRLHAGEHDIAVGAVVATYCVSDIAEEWDLEALLTEAKTLWPSQIELAAFEA